MGMDKSGIGRNPPRRSAWVHALRAARLAEYRVETVSVGRLSLPRRRRRGADDVR